jgi:hypothetical protein
MYLSTGHRIYLLKVVWNFEEVAGGWLVVTFRREAVYGHRIWDFNVLNVCCSPSAAKEYYKYWQFCSWHIAVNNIASSLPPI